MFCTCPSKEMVQKARSKRPRWKDTRTDRRMSALHSQMSRSISADLVTGVKKFKSRIPDKEAIYEAWLKGGYSKIMELIPWHRMVEDVMPAAHRTKDALFGSMDINREALPKPINKALRFDYSNPRIERTWAKRTGEWMVNPLVNGGRDAIQDIVHRQFTQGLDPRSMAGEIRGYIGLYPRLANALTNYKQGLAAKGMPIENQQKYAIAYEDRLLDYRSMMIARTETNFMLNRGQLEVWRQANDAGLIPNAAVKVWQADGSPCEDCSAMDGEEVGLAEAWVTPDGDVVDVPTEIHPNCNCIMTIDYREGEANGDQEADEEQPAEDAE